MICDAWENRYRLLSKLSGKEELDNLETIKPGTEISTSAWSPRSTLSAPLQKWRIVVRLCERPTSSTRSAGTVIEAFVPNAWRLAEVPYSFRRDSIILEIDPPGRSSQLRPGERS